MNNSSSLGEGLQLLAKSLPLAPETYWHGDRTLAARPSAAVLNSRQSKYPTGKHPWVKATLRAVARVVSDEQVLLSSIGLSTWELATWASAEALGSVILLVPLPEGMIQENALIELQRIFDDFGLLQQQALAIPYFVPQHGNPKGLWPARDALILCNADRLLPVSVRDGGFMDTSLHDKTMSPKVDERYRVEYDPKSYTWQPPPDPSIVRKSLSGLDWDHAVHWTRTAQGPWPGESSADYYKAVVESDTYPRDAGITLGRILETGVLFGSGRRMPMGFEMVSLSAAHPADMVERMRWRKRYVRMEYEPYGIAIRRGALTKLGGRKVIYGDTDARKKLSATDRLYFQTLSPDADWESECEWRVRGNLDLSELSDDDAILLLPDEETAAQFQQSTRFSVRSLTHVST